MSGLNNKFLGTKSRVLTIPSIVCSYITGLIDGTVNLEGLEYEEEFYDISQKLKRLLYYTSSNPFAKKAQNLNGESVIQKDITKSLLVTQAKNEDNNCIFNGLVNTDMKSDERFTVFISDLSCTPMDIAMGKCRIAITFIVPDVYDSIKFLEESDIPI